MTFAGFFAGALLIVSSALTACGDVRSIALQPDATATQGGDGGSGAGGGTSSTRRDAGLPPADPNRTYAPTFQAVWDEILRPTCGTEFCHGGDHTLFDLGSKKNAYLTLVGVPARGSDCLATKLLHIAPGKPDESLVYLKVTKPPCGMRMPPPYGAPSLDARSVAQIRRWIERGAPNDSVWDGGTGAHASKDASSDAQGGLDGSIRDAAKD